MAIYNRDFLSVKHDLYKENISNWEFYIRSYLGGNDYKNGYHLHRYILETPEEYEQRIRHTPIDNHCRNVIQIYSSFLWSYHCCYCNCCGQRLVATLDCHHINLFT